jgi:3-deoxy-D-manno-octulosonic acid kinase
MLGELRVGMHAIQCSVPTAQPVAVRIERLCGPLFSAHFISRRIPDALNLLDFCRQTDGQPIARPAERFALARAIAGAVARMHDAGILHADLNLKNILVRTVGPQAEAFVIDFDKSRLLPSVPLSGRVANLRRLARSTLKWSAARRSISIADRLRVLRCYLERYPQWASEYASIARAHPGHRAGRALSRRTP